MDQKSLKIKSHVLIIEDDRSVRRMLRFSLIDSGFDVDEVDSGSAAIARLERDTPDAVIVDLGLSDGRGAAVLEWLHQHREIGKPVWVVVSALDQEEAAKKYGCLGQYFIPKPFNPWNLVELLERLLREG